MSVIDTPLLVLGAGPGGYTAAFRAADLGLATVLVERYPRLGGVCLNVGCIPSKAQLHVARVLAEAEELTAEGIELGITRPQPAAVRAWTERVVGRLTEGLRGLAARRGVRVLQGTGQLASARELELETAEGRLTLRFEQAILAAGSRAVTLPGLPADPRIMDSTAALQLRDIPRRLLVVGGGIIGLELATVYDALGARVSVVEAAPELMPGCDPDLLKPLRKRIERRYEALWTATTVLGVEARPEALRVRLRGAEAPAEAEFDALLVAVGRRANADRIGAERAGLTLDARGAIPVDERMRTGVEGLLAIGDLTGAPMLAHRAAHQGKVAAEVAAGLNSAFDARSVPSVAYTDPEVAWVGLTETEARAQGRRVAKGVFPWAASGRALAVGRDEGLTKLLFEPETRRLLGAGIVGPNAGELIGEATLALEMDCDALDVALTIHPHPTLSETLGFAAEAFEGTLTDLYLPRR